MHVHGNGTLVLDDVTQDDAGGYKCVGVSSGGAADQAFTSQLELSCEYPIYSYTYPQHTHNAAAHQRGIFLAKKSSKRDVLVKVVCEEWAP